MKIVHMTVMSRLRHINIVETEMKQKDANKNKAALTRQSEKQSCESTVHLRHLVEFRKTLVLSRI